MRQSSQCRPNWPSSGASFSISSIVPFCPLSCFCFCFLLPFLFQLLPLHPRKPMRELRVQYAFICNCLPGRLPWFPNGATARRSPRGKEENWPLRDAACRTKKLNESMPMSPNIPSQPGRPRPRRIGARLITMYWQDISRTDPAQLGRTSQASSQELCLSLGTHYSIAKPPVQEKNTAHQYAHRRGTDLGYLHFLMQTVDASNKSLPPSLPSTAGFQEARCPTSHAICTALWR